jgi:hypothetical protein
MQQEVAIGFSGQSKCHAIRLGGEELLSIPLLRINRGSIASCLDKGELNGILSW